LPFSNIDDDTSEPRRPRIPFGDFLRSLADPSAKILMIDLERLSGLERGRLDEFSAAWKNVPAERRRRVLEDLAEIAEDNVDLDFAGVFRIGLVDHDPAVRTAAAAGLWEDEEPATTLALLDRLARDESWAVRAEAAGSLGGAALRVEMGEVSATLAGKIRAGLFAALENAAEPVAVRRRALEALGCLGDERVREHIRRAYAGENDQMRLSAVHAMGRSASADWLETIWKELASTNPEMRYEAAHAAGEIGDERSVRPLALLLTDDDHEVRFAAIGALGEIGGDQAVRALRYLAQQSEDEDTKEAAAEALEEALAASDPLRAWSD
jgi:HEAT repeat protein